MKKVINIRFFGILFLIYLSSCASNEGKIGLNIHSASSEINKPNLWILGIGINEYKNFPVQIDNGGWFLNLNNPVNDTRKLVRALENHKGKTYNDVHSLYVFDNEATKNNIISHSFQYLEQAKPNDVIILYINAHGITMEDGTYCFFPYDIAIVSEDTGANRIDYSSSVNIHDIMGALNIPAKKILFLETCGSGGAVNIENIFGIKNDDIIIFAACGQDEEAVENNLYGSIFTDGFVQKINNHNYKESPLTIETLFEYMYDYVIRINARSIFNDTQHPQLFVPEKYNNFIILNSE